MTSYRKTFASHHYNSQLLSVFRMINIPKYNSFNSKQLVFPHLVMTSFKIFTSRVSPIITINNYYLTSAWTTPRNATPSTLLSNLCCHKKFSSITPSSFINMIYSTLKFFFCFQNKPKIGMKVVMAWFICLKYSFSDHK